MNREWTRMNAKRRRINPTAAERRFRQIGLGDLLSSFLLTVSVHVCVHPRFVFFFASIRVHSRLILLFRVVRALTQRFSRVGSNRSWIFLSFMFSLVTATAPVSKYLGTFPPSSIVTAVAQPLY